MKSLSVGADLFHADGQTDKRPKRVADRQEANSRFS
jgi:hypothetical protein